MRLQCKNVLNRKCCERDGEKFSSEACLIPIIILFERVMDPNSTYLKDPLSNCVNYIEKQLFGLSSCNSESESSKSCIIAALWSGTVENKNEFRRMMKICKAVTEVKHSVNKTDPV